MDRTKKGKINKKKPKSEKLNRQLFRKIAKSDLHSKIARSD